MSLDRTEELKNLSQRLVEQAYQRGYEDAYNDQAYEMELGKYIKQGRDEAWDATKRILAPLSRNGLTNNQILEIFEVDTAGQVFTHYSASEAIYRLNDYDGRNKEKEIKVGDEVYMLDPNHKVVVTSDDLGNGEVVCISAEGTWSANPINQLHKTGKHYPEITDVLHKLMGD